LVAVYKPMPAPGEPPLFAVIIPDGDGGFDAQVRDEAGEVYVVLRGYHTVALSGQVKI